MMMLINNKNQLNYKLKYEIKSLLDDMRVDFESLAADNQAAVQLLNSQKSMNRQPQKPVIGKLKRDTSAILEESKFEDSESQMLCD